MPSPKKAHAKPSQPPADAEQLLGVVRSLPPLVPDAEYTGVFSRAERGRVERRERWFIWLAISMPGPHLKKELYLSCPCPERGGPFGLSSKLVKAVTIATGALPERRDRITTKVFKGKLFRFQTRTVKHDKDEVLRPKSEHYSVIDKLLSVETQ
ncbi:MAG: hypothetical protein HOP32_16380 [Nitrospira sp.]|nr:hypothetical protein [Nitrospira sp.]